MPTPCWCVVCTLLQDDDCGSGSGNVYNDTTITTTTKAAAKAMAGNNNSKQTQFKRRWNRLKFQYSLLYLISLHGYTPPNWIIEDWKRNIFRYTPFSTRIHILSLSYSLLVSSYVSLTPRIFLSSFASGYVLAVFSTVLRIFIILFISTSFFYALDQANSLCVRYTFWTQRMFEISRLMFKY